MRGITVILMCLAFIGYVAARRSSGWSEHLNGWQKLFGLVAVVLAVLILVNPDLLALGMLGDTTFFDVLVMALGLQMVVLVQMAWRRVGAEFVRGARWIGVPSPGLRFLLIFSAGAVGIAISSLQKVVHRVIS